jgi:2-polyprenyl-6-methoxyphenol hydroxylase-like FAD-dependent oxidoreductase
MTRTLIKSFFLLSKLIHTRTRTYSTGYDTYLFARPQLYQLMLSRIPSEKIVMNRKVLTFEQNALGVMIRCNEGSQYHGDVLVGADGAYSSVRQTLYKKMVVKGLLPKSDNESLNLGFITMVGVTQPLDSKRYPCLNENEVNFSQVVGGQNLSVSERLTMRYNIFQIVSNVIPPRVDYS